MAAIFGALSNPTRLHIVNELSDGPLKVTALADRIGIGQSSASQHLAVLERAGLLKATPIGAGRHYGVRGPRVVQLLHTMEEFCTIHGLAGMPETQDGLNDA